MTQESSQSIAVTTVNNYIAFRDCFSYPRVTNDVAKSGIALIQTCQEAAKENRKRAQWLLKTVGHCPGQTAKSGQYGKKGRGSRVMGVGQVTFHGTLLSAFLCSKNTCWRVIYITCMSQVYT